jgi:hypothetical protein
MKRKAKSIGDLYDEMIKKERPYPIDPKPVTDRRIKEVFKRTWKRVQRQKDLEDEFDKWANGEDV